MAIERPISESEMRAVLKLRPDGVLVGGQSLAVWARYFGLEKTVLAAPAISYDIDFLGSGKAAESVGRKLPAEVFRVQLGDPTPSAATIVAWPDDTSYVRIDFLASVAGLDNRRIKARAAKVTVFDAEVAVMHPVDCLASRLENLLYIPEKRSRRGLAQAQLAIEIVRAFVTRQAQNPRAALKWVEEVGRIAASRAGAAARANWEIDALQAIPAQLLPETFRKKRLPQLVADAERKARAAPKL
jgi:hypothetical protein